MTRNYSIDTIKFVAAVFVVILHAEFGGVTGFFIDSIASIAVPFFFIISGYLLSTQKDKESYIKKQITKISFYYVCAIIIYIPFYLALYPHRISLVLKNIWSVIAIPEPFAPHLWFLAALIASFFLILKLKLYKNKKASLYLSGALWILGTIFFFLNVSKVIITPWWFFLNALFFGLPLILFGLFLIPSFLENIKSKQDIRKNIIYFLVMYFFGIVLRVMMLKYNIIYFSLTTVPIMTLPAILLAISTIKLPKYKKVNSIFLLNFHIYLWHRLFLLMFKEVLPGGLEFGSVTSYNYPLNFMVIIISIIMSIGFGILFEKAFKNIKDKIIK